MHEGAIALLARGLSEHADGDEQLDRATRGGLRRDARLRWFGAVAVWGLDRLGRSALDILQAVEAFDARGVLLYITKDALETSGTASRLIITVLAGVAQLERDLISERTRLGLAPARRRGSARRSHVLITLIAVSA